MRARGVCRMLPLAVAVIGMLCGCTGNVHTPRQSDHPTGTEAKKIQCLPMEFPAALADSRLVAEKIVHYSGAYWEDGSGSTVENVAGLMLSNPTDRMIEFVSLVVEQAEEHLYFFAYRLPPMSRCLVLEYNKKTCDPQKVTDCRVLTLRWDRQDFSRQQVDYVGLGPLMTVINRDARELGHVTVWYKQYVKSEDYYLGGAAQSVHMFSLQPEERRTVRPAHYEAGKARIVAIELEI